MFPAIIRGVCKIIMYLFSGGNIISGAITYNPVFLESILKYKAYNRLVFGVKSDEKHAPIEVNNLLIIIISLDHCTVVEPSDEQGESIVVKINVTISSLTHDKECDFTWLALFDDIYWRTIRVQPLIIA